MTHEITTSAVMTRFGGGPPEKAIFTNAKTSAMPPSSPKAVANNITKKVRPALISAGFIFVLLSRDADVLVYRKEEVFARALCLKFEKK